jgi:hypothetical protein
MPIPAVTIPASVLAAPFPTNADRTAGTFNAKAVDWANSENAMATRTREIAEAARLNALTANTAATEANASVGDAAAQVTLAATQVTLATDQATIAVGAVATSGALLWVSGATYAIGNLIYSPLNFQNYRRRTVGAGAVDPSLDTANWAAVAPAPSIIRSARTSNTALSAVDNSCLIDITSGTFTQTFVDAATLGSGWFCYIRNAGAGNITLDPNASELIDGLTSFVMYPGEVRLIQCDGLALRSIVLNAFYLVFTASGNFIKPPGYSAFYMRLWSGGAGGCSSQGGVANGANGGGCFPATLYSAEVGNLTSVVIGSGGLGSSLQGVSNSGGNSTFGALITVFGGKSSIGGSVINNSNAAGLDGFSGASPGNNEGVRYSIWGGAGGGAIGVGAIGQGGNSLYGGAGGNSVTGSGAQPPESGVSIFGGNGGAGSASGVAFPGGARGGAGGSSNTNGGTGGPGGRGECQISGVI